jgi:Zn-finger nucleic acid-binding protein
MNCPRDGTELKIEHHHGIEVDHCPECNGRWLDHEELDHLEATVTKDAGARVATIQYAKRSSDLNCPVCGNPMTAFNYRAYNLELDTCRDQHGFWLDAGEDGKVRDIIEERIRDLRRSASAEAAWSGFLDDLRGGRGGTSIWDRIKRGLGGR